MGVWIVAMGQVLMSAKEMDRLAVYSDRHSIFRVNHGRQEGKVAQFKRALKTLDMEPIHATSRQAKGRVERANQTLQDRLVKELRVESMDGMDQGNAFLPVFIADYNRRLAVAAQLPGGLFFRMAQLRMT